MILLVWHSPAVACGGAVPSWKPGRVRLSRRSPRNRRRTRRRRDHRSGRTQGGISRPLPNPSFVFLDGCPLYYENLEVLMGFRSRRSGFTLIELLVVIAIIAILA